MRYLRGIYNIYICGHYMNIIIKEFIFMGRTSFVIDPVRLKGLRVSAGLTQQKLMSTAYEILGRSPEATSKTLIGHYQRIEKNGHTSKALADALAKVLDTTVEVLQGKDTPESYHYMEKLVKQLQEQLNYGNNQVLNQELYAWNNERKKIRSEVSEGIDNFAREIAIQIELAQLFGQTDELIRLREITGWSNEQILNPANVHGHWFIRETMMDSMSTSLVYGLGDIFYRIREIINKVRHFYTDDLHVNIKHAYPWIHFEITNPRHNDFHKSSIIMSRTLPTPDGLKWVSPNEADKWNLSRLDDIAFSEANFVTLNDGLLYPADVRNLRFKIVEVTDFEKRRTAYSDGWLRDSNNTSFDRFLASGQSHNWVVNRLIGGVAEGLRTHLNPLPEATWKVDAYDGQINLVFDTWKIPTEQRRSLGFSHLNYIINLVEQLPDGKYRSAPWAKKSIDEAVKDLKKRLQSEWASESSISDDVNVRLHFDEYTII